MEKPNSNNKVSELRVMNAILSEVPKQMEDTISVALQTLKDRLAKMPKDSVVRHQIEKFVEGA